jgi:DNA-binding LytR/AlgR family response regulator
MPLDLLEEVVESELVLLEDEKTAREQLTALLTRKGFKVRPVASGHVAVSSMELAEPISGRVFLIDIEMEQGDLDGIDAASQIQSRDPYSSFILVTGFSGDANYRQRVEETELRIGGWIEKPISEERLNRLATMIRKEMKKVEIRIAISRSKGHGVTPVDALLSISSYDTHISHESIEELLRELKKQEDSSSRIERDFMARDAEIDSLYTEIRSLAARSASDPGLKSQIEPLKKRLRALQDEEATEAEHQFNARLHLEPGSGLKALALAKRLAGR